MGHPSAWGLLTVVSGTAGRHDERCPAATMAGAARRTSVSRLTTRRGRVRTRPRRWAMERGMSNLLWKRRVRHPVRVRKEVVGSIFGGRSCQARVPRPVLCPALARHNPLPGADCPEDVRSGSLLHASEVEPDGPMRRAIRRAGRIASDRRALRSQSSHRGGLRRTDGLVRHNPLSTRGCTADARIMRGSQTWPTRLPDLSAVQSVRTGGLRRTRAQ